MPFCLEPMYMAVLLSPWQLMSWCLSKIKKVSAAKICKNEKNSIFWIELNQKCCFEIELNLLVFSGSDLLRLNDQSSCPHQHVNSTKEEHINMWGRWRIHPRKMQLKLSDKDMQSLGPIPTCFYAYGCWIFYLPSIGTSRLCSESQCLGGLARWLSSKSPPSCWNPRCHLETDWWVVLFRQTARDCAVDLRLTGRTFVWWWWWYSVHKTVHRVTCKTFRHSRRDRLPFVRVWEIGANMGDCSVLAVDSRTYSLYNSVYHIGHIVVM